MPIYRNDKGKWKKKNSTCPQHAYEFFIQREIFAYLRLLNMTLVIADNPKLVLAGD